MITEMYPIVEFENGDFMIKGYCERRYIHKTGLKHMTSLIIPVLSYDEGRILTMDKCEKYIYEALELGDPIPVAQMSVDIFGGHLDYEELTAKEKQEGVISEDMMKRNAGKRLEERLLMKSDNGYMDITVNLSKMKFIGTYECREIDNNEVGYVYTYEMMPGDYMAEIIEYTNTGEIKKLRLEVTEFLLSELFSMNDIFKTGKSSGYKICDGLGRILDTGDELYTIMNIKKPENGKGIDKKLRKFNICIEAYPPVSRDSENSVLRYYESFFGTQRQANERGYALAKQRAGELNIATANISYSVEAM